ncbi:MAG: Rrf2 family transcriptional regulator [candidate division Zixibacteria bacterium]|nr:Rrf2 family transcriptional regulator [candidate division Zixibacteria bacterium]
MFSSKTYLALLVVLELSQRERSAPLTSRHLARQYNVSKRYLEVVFNNLAKAGIISSKRGIGGGYFLASDIDKLNIYDLSMAAEGGIKIFAGGEYLDEEGDRAGLIRDINLFWNDLNEEVMEKLKSHKLSDLVSRLSDLKEMYYI